MNKEYNINGIIFTFKFSGIDNIYRINYDKIDTIIDPSSKDCIKLIKTKYSNVFRICEVSDKVSEEIIDKLKSDYEFYSELISVINKISSCIKPYSIDITEITGDSDDIIRNSDNLTNIEILVKWKYREIDDYGDKIIITVF